MASRLDSKLIRWSIGGSSVGCIGCSSGIRSFRQLFLCRESLGMGQLVALYQFGFQLQGSRQLEKSKKYFELHIRFLNLGILEMAPIYSLRFNLDYLSDYKFDK